MTEPLISVIVPFWNAEPWIERCVNSLKRQRGNFEFILVDDSSDDAGARIAHDLIEDDERFSDYCITPHKGVSDARNAGLLMSKGEWITFLDADDVLQLNAYRKFLKILSEDPKAFIHQANHLRYYEKAERLDLKYPNRPGKYDMQHLPKSYSMVWNKLFYGAVARHINFVHGLQFGEDEIYVLEYLAQLKKHQVEDYIHCSSEVTVVKHLENKESLSHIHHKKEESLLRQIKELTAFLKKHKDPEVRKMVLGILSDHWSSKVYEKTFCGGE